MRRKADDNGKKSSSEDETVVTRIGKKESAGLLSAKTVCYSKYIKNEIHIILLFIVCWQSKSTKKSRQEIRDSSDEEVKQKVTVVFQSDRNVENKKDDLATSTVQIDTAIDQDARTIFEKSLQGRPI